MRKPDAQYCPRPLQVEFLSHGTFYNGTKDQLLHAARLPARWWDGEGVAWKRKHYFDFDGHPAVILKIGRRYHVRISKPAALTTEQRAELMRKIVGGEHSGPGW
jgi:hypothetical protein